MSNEKRMQLVILSATTDETLRNDIESQLIHAKINVWHTGKIQAGDMRKNVIEAELRKADIIMPLISADFWTQKARRNELQGFIMPIVRDLRKKGITIIPVLAKPYHWEMSEFKDLDPLPSTGKPIAVGNKKLDDLLEIAITLSEMAENLSPTPKSNAETKDTSYIEPQKTTEKMPTNTEKPIVFIVHGHNDNMKDKVELFVKNLDFKPIVLHKQINGGRTIIEKFEEYAKKATYAIVILSADDYGYAKKRDETTKQLRARQNVVFELGFFTGRLGRQNVAVLQETATNFESVGDYSGVVYVPYDSESWNIRIAREMKAAGLSVDFEKLF